MKILGWCINSKEKTRTFIEAMFLSQLLFEISQIFQRFLIVLKPNIQSFLLHFT